MNELLIQDPKENGQNGLWAANNEIGINESTITKD